MFRLLLPLLALVPGCPASDVDNKNRAQQAAGALLIHNVKVDLRLPPAARDPRIDQRALLARVKQKLKASGAVKLVQQKGPESYDLRVLVAVGPDPEGISRSGLLVVCSGRGEVPDKIGGVALQASVVAHLDHKDKLHARTRSALDGMLADLLYQAHLTNASERQLIAALSQKDSGRLAAAVEMVAVRKVKQALEPVARLLKHKEQAVADRAIGALVALGDPRAVKHLTRMTKFSDTERMAKVLDAVGALGGKEAVQYLEFVATGHEDEDIRSMAREALERMTRKRARAAKKGGAKSLE